MCIRDRLSFDVSTTAGGTGQDQSAIMLIDEQTDVLPPGEVFKRKLRSTAGLPGHDKVRVVEPSSGKFESLLTQAEVARQPRQDQ